jgi:hypothetical protein
MPGLKNRNLFISHSWSYGNAYSNFVKMLNSANNFNYSNYSVPKNDPVHDANNAAQLYTAIKNKMIFCDVIIIMAGKYATYSKWIQNEIKIAKEDFNKPILAVRPWANEQTSTVVSGAADVLVNWNTDSIVSAIRQLDP